MGSCGCGSGVSVIQEVKPLITAGSLQFNNGITLLSPNYVQLGGPLVQDTTINGNFNLQLGQSNNRLTSLSINTNTTISLNFYNGSVGNSLSLSSTGVLLTDTTTNPKGLVGASDYSANYSSLAYTQKTYVDNYIGGKVVSSLVTTPTNSQNGYAITWDNTNQRYTLTNAIVTVPGSNTQVLFNNAGSFGAIATVTWVTGNFTVDDTLTIGQASTSANKTLTVQGSTSDINLNLVPINNGSLNIKIKGTGVVNLGLVSDASTVRKITAISSNAQTDISIEPNGQNGVLYFGDSTQAGAYRYISPNGTSSNVSIVLQSKGTGDLIADGGNFLLGLVTEANTTKQIKVQSNTNAHLILTPAGNGKVLIGDPTSNTSDQEIQATNSTGNVNLNVMAGGTGTVNLRGTAVNAYGDINLISVRLGINGSFGTSGQVFTSNGSSPPSWQTPAGGYSDPLTTIGDILYRNNSNATARFPIGTDGQVLTISSGNISWGAISGLLSGLTATRVPFASSGNALVDDGALTWDNGNKILSVGNGTLGIISVNTGSGVNVIRTYISSTLEFYLNNSTVSGSVFTNVNSRPISFVTGGVTRFGINANGSIGFNGAVGTSGQLLQSNGSGAPPTWVTFTGIPAGSNTQIQFNASGSFGASPNLLWTGSYFIVADIPGNVSMLGVSPNPANFNYIQGATGNATTPKGGSWIIQGGNPYSVNGSGGDISITAGGHTGTGIDGKVSIGSKLYLTSVANDNSQTKILVLNSSDNSVQYRSVLSLPSPIIVNNYSPTLTGITNINTVTAPANFVFRYDGALVEVFGSIDVYPTTSGTWGNVIFNISPPPGYSTIFSNTSDATGIVSGVYLGGATTPISGIIEGIPSSSSFKCTFTSTNPANAYRLKIHIVYAVTI